MFRALHKDTAANSLRIILQKLLQLKTDFDTFDLWPLNFESQKHIESWYGHGQVLSQVLWSWLSLKFVVELQCKTRPEMLVAIQTKVSREIEIQKLAEKNIREQKKPLAHWLQGAYVNRNPSFVCSKRSRHKYTIYVSKNPLPIPPFYFLNSSVQNQVIFKKVLVYDILKQFDIGITTWGKVCFKNSCFQSINQSFIAHNTENKC